MKDFVKNNFLNLTSIGLLIIMVGSILFYLLVLRPKDTSKIDEIKKEQEIYVEENKIFTEQQKEFILSAVSHKAASDSIGKETIIKNNYYYEKIKDIDSVDSLDLTARIRFALTGIGTISFNSTRETINTKNP